MKSAAAGEAFARLLEDVEVRALPGAGMLTINQAGGPALFLHAHQVRHSLTGILHALKSEDAAAFVFAVDRVRQFLR
jgi:hypothetical protein